MSKNATAGSAESPASRSNKLITRVEVVLKCAQLARGREATYSTSLVVFTHCRTVSIHDLP